MNPNESDNRLIVLNPSDNVAVLRAPVVEGETIVVSGVRIIVQVYIGMGHKIAVQKIKPDDKIRKYGVPIGSATDDIAIGDHVHLHNMKSDYTPTHSLEDARAAHGAPSGQVPS